MREIAVCRHGQLVMIATSFPSTGGTRRGALAPSNAERKREGSGMMNVLSDGTRAGDEALESFAGVGSFRCRNCGYVLTLSGTDLLGDCPSCCGTATRSSSAATGSAIWS